MKRINIKKEVKKIKDKTLETKEKIKKTTKKVKEVVKINHKKIVQQALLLFLLPFGIILSFGYLAWIYIFKK
ncbi:hypothetical protein J4436_02460 [Candidatus Woesearchaeota archaeon]|nr:hypothetical protein [Candidatus Woesearchaeota archaeon]